MTTQEIQVPNAETVPISQLKTDGQNPNKMTREQLDRLKRSIQQYGFIVPIITNKDLVIADGEQRWIVANELAMKEVSVIRLPVEDVDRRLLRQVLNKLKGEHELLADAEEFEKIIVAGREDDLKFLVDLNDSKLERYLRELHPPKDEDYEIPEIEKVHTDIKRGDILQLGKHRLMCGDATKDKLTLDMELPHMIFTDPPYGLGDYAGRSGKHIAIEGDNYSQAKECLKVIDTTLPTYVCCDWRVFPDVVSILGYPNSLIVWDKEYYGMGIGYRHQHEFIAFYGKIEANNEVDVWHIKREPDRHHPTQKPLNLCERAIRNSSAPEEIVLDMFGGSGSTLIACEQTGRVCYMMEIDPRYCEIICQRWEKYTGQKREMVKDGGK